MIGFVIRSNEDRICFRKKLGCCFPWERNTVIMSVYFRSRVRNGNQEFKFYALLKNYK